MKRKIGLIDYGVNNISSVSKILKKLDIPFEIVSDGKNLNPFGHIILPGVGAFEEGCKNLLQRGLAEAIRQQVNRGAYLLGICLGMQLLFESSEESDSSVNGLSIIKGNCKILSDFPNEKIYIPHIGWNSLHITNGKTLLNNVANGTDFYFLHSYCVQPNDPEIITATCRHGVDFPAAVEHENVMGTQFHPEKSFSEGMTLFNNFYSLN